MASRDAAWPGAAQIDRICAEWAEVAWLRVKRRGLADPVIELWALDATDPDRVLISAAGRGELARALDLSCPGVALAEPRRGVIPTIPQGVGQGGES